MTAFYILQNMMRQEALKAMSSKTYTALGVVAAYDQINYLAQVQLYPAEDDGTSALNTGWLPIAAPWVGNGWGMFMPPSPGDVVEVHFQEGSQQNGYIALRLFNPSALPLSVPAGEFWLVHSTGSYIKCTNDGHISINGQAAIDITTPDLNIIIDGNANIQASGSVTIDSLDVKIGDTGGSLTGLMNNVAIGIFNAHVHSGVQTGSGDSGPPTTTLDSSSLTTNVTAN